MSVQNTIGVRTLCPREDILRNSMSMCCSLFPFAVLSEPSLCAAVELCVCVCARVYMFLLSIPIGAFFKKILQLWGYFCISPTVKWNV